MTAQLWWYTLNVCFYIKTANQTNNYKIPLHDIKTKAITLFYPLKQNFQSSSLLHNYHKSIVSNQQFLAAKYSCHKNPQANYFSLSHNKQTFLFITYFFITFQGKSKKKQKIRRKNCEIQKINWMWKISGLLFMCCRLHFFFSWDRLGICGDFHETFSISEINLAIWCWCNPATPSKTTARHTRYRY